MSFHQITLSRVVGAGLANDKAIHIEGDGQGLKVTKLISKHANKPSKAKSSSTRKKSFQRVSHGLNKELDGYRPDLKVISVLLSDPLLFPGLDASCRYMVSACLQCQLMPSAESCSS